jgi:DNA-binding MarR family transcriptional regulator
MTAVSDKRIDRLRRAVDLLRTLEHEFPGQLMSVLFYVAAHDGCTTLEARDAIGLGDSSVSRCTDWLCDRHRLGKPGLGLIVKKVDPVDRRYRRLTLTTKGRFFMNQIKEIIYDDQD